uniref:Tail repeat-like protein n=1 Tax=virus sp. ctoC338 TaxID=2827997 RepID=A0A8S5SWN2_9VIRU|nr:MAG TPA: tail repeat-like protein [virus sp. ctoC338]
MAMTFGTLDFAVAFNRQTAFPLDAKSYFESLEAAQAAAASAQEAGSSETVYYYGQQIAVVDSGKATLYVIQPDKTLKEVGGNILINENVFSKSEDGTLDLLGFADAVGGAQLVKTEDGKVSWVKPDTTTVEGLSTAIESLKTTVGDDKSGLVKQVADNKAAIDTLNGASTVQGSVAYQIAQVVAGADESFDTLKEIADWIAGHKTDAASMNSQINTNKDDIAALKTKVGDTSVADQIAAAVDAALKDGESDKYALADDLATANGKITALQGLVGETAVATQISDAIDGALKVDGAEKYALASHTHEIANVTGLQAILDAKAAANDVETLQSTVDGLEAKAHEHANKTVLDTISEDKVNAWDAAQANVIEFIKLNGTAIAPAADKSVNIAIPAATAEVLGLVKVDGDSIVTSDGVISVGVVSTDKLVQGSDTLIMDGGNA